MLFVMEIYQKNPLMIGILYLKTPTGWGEEPYMRLLEKQINVWGGWSNGKRVREKYIRELWIF